MGAKRRCTGGDWWLGARQPGAGLPACLPAGPADGHHIAIAGLGPALARPWPHSIPRTSGSPRRPEPHRPLPGGPKECGAAQGRMRGGGVKSLRTECLGSSRHAGRRSGPHTDPAPSSYPHISSSLLTHICALVLCPSRQPSYRQNVFPTSRFPVVPSSTTRGMAGLSCPSIINKKTDAANHSNSPRSAPRPHCASGPGRNDEPRMEHESMTRWTESE